MIQKIINKLHKSAKVQRWVGVLITQHAIYLIIYPIKGQAKCMTDSAEISDPSQMSVVFKQLLNNHNLANGLVNIIVPHHMYHLMAVDKPDVDEADIGTSIKYTAKEYIPGQLEDFVIDYFDIPAQPFGQNKVNLVAAKYPELKKLSQIALDAGLAVNKIIIEELVYKDLFEQTEDAIMLLTQQKNEELLLHIQKNGQLYFYRKLRGYNKIDQFSELEIINSAADNLSLEIQRSLDYFESQIRQAPVKRIYFAIPNPSEAALIEKVGENFPIPVLPLKTWFKNELPENIQEYGYFAASATALSLKQGGRHEN